LVSLVSFVGKRAPAFRALACVAFAAAIAAFVVGVRWGTAAAGGSDSSCYLNQARLFARGTTHIEQPLVIAAPWPRAEWSFAPAGHIPSPVRRDFIVPMCPPGLPLAMAAFRLAHVSEGLTVPLLGALGVWLTFVLGRQLHGPLTGAAAAVLFACSPIFLFQVVQPMTDVPAATWWLLVAVLAIEGKPAAAGLAASIAVLTRPNLLPLVGIVAIYILTRSAGEWSERDSRHEQLGRRSTVKRFRATGWLMVGLAPGLVLLAALQTLMYGSPVASGYGAVANLFHASNVAANLQRYPRWLWETHTPLLALAVVGPFLVRRRADGWLCLALPAATLIAYLPYRLFDAWWYLRFLLPGLPFLIVLSVTVIVRVVDYVIDHRYSVVAAIVIAMATMWINTARQRSAFDLRRLEHHFVEAGTFAASRFPRDAAVLTVTHSGSVHYYSQRTTVSWDTLDPGSLDRTLAFLRAQGLMPYLLLDAMEEPEFRARFSAASKIGQLDWPPVASASRTIRVYAPADRDRYFAR